MVFTLAEKPVGQAQKTVALARKLKTPCLHLHRGMLGLADKLVTFLEKHYVRRLNIVGATEAKEPGLYAWVMETLDKTKVVLDQREE